LIFSYLQNLFKNKLEKQIWSVLNDGRAFFSSFGNDVYLSDQVNNCINRIAEEIGKVDIVSVVTKPGSVIAQNDEITRLFKFKPNPIQTTKDFLESCEWLRRKDMNCFIYPQYDIIYDANKNPIRYYTAFWPLNPTEIELGLDDSGEIWEIKFYFKDGITTVLPYSDIVHLRWRRGKNLLVGGGNDYGMTDTKDLLRAVQTLDTTMQVLPKALESSLQIKGIYHAKTVSEGKLMDKTREDLEKHIKTSSLGITAVDLAGEFTPINITPPQLDAEVMKSIKSIIWQRYGISEALLSGDYTAEQHGAFYQSCIESFIGEFEQAMTACIFTQREQDVGHRVKCYYSKVAYMTNAQKTELAQVAVSTGLMTLNQVADMFGFEPFEGGDRRLQSLNYVNTNIVDNYQLNMARKGNTEPAKGTAKGGNSNE